MVNPSPLSGEPQCASTPREGSVVRKNYTELLRKRSTYPAYFAKGLEKIDLALKRVAINRETYVVRPHAIFGEYSREYGAQFKGMTPIEFITSQVPRQAVGKEKETLEKYSDRLKTKRFTKEKKREKEKKRARLLYHKACLERKKWAAEAVNHAEVLRSAARAAGVNEEPEVRKYLGAQIAPPPNTLHGWIKEPEHVTRAEVNEALHHFGKRVVFNERRKLECHEPQSRAPPTVRQSLCNSCRYTGDGKPGECPNCGARLSVFRPAKTPTARPKKRHPNGKGFVPNTGERVDGFVVGEASGNQMPR
jgi:hypothetical protein